MKFTGRKGWVASYSDAWDLDYTLSPIIAAGLRKFLEKRESDFFGTPNSIFRDYGLDHDNKNDCAIAHIIWNGILDNMLFAFETEEPDISKYGFSMRLENKTITSEGKEEKARYDKDLKEYWDLRQKGTELFGKYFHSLWW